MRPAAVLLDANLLVLLIVGTVDKRRIASHHRLGGFSAVDFDVLRDFLFGARTIIVTPNILTEASNLVGNPKNPNHRSYFEGLQAIVIHTESFTEVYVPSAEALGHPCFRYLGLTDAGIVQLADRDTIVLSCDNRLVAECLSAGLQATTFDRLRMGN